MGPKHCPPALLTGQPIYCDNHPPWRDVIGLTETVIIDNTELPIPTEQSLLSYRECPDG